MPTARSYQNLEIVKEPYYANGRAYVQVMMPSGSVKTVRWYTEAELKKYGKSAAPAASEPKKAPREALGFGEKGYITIFKGDTYASKDWFKIHGAKYTKAWGWAFAEDVPEELPLGVEAIQLPWEMVSQENGELKPDEQIKEAVDSLIYEPDDSEFVGEIGDRMEIEVTIEKAIDLNGYYGLSTMHIMRDNYSGNVFVWTTASKHWEEGVVKTIRGTVKDHRTYRNVNQTVLTRCTEVGVK